MLSLSDQAESIEGFPRVPPVRSNQLRDPGPRGIQDLKHRPVPNSRVRGRIRQIQQLFHFLFAPDGRKPAGATLDPEVLGRVVLPNPAADQKPVIGTKTRKPTIQGGIRQFLPVEPIGVLQDPFPIQVRRGTFDVKQVQKLLKIGQILFVGPDRIGRIIPFLPAVGQEVSAPFRKPSLRRISQGSFPPFPRTDPVPGR